MRSRLAVPLLLLVLASATARAQPVDPGWDPLGTNADFSTVTVGPLPDRPDSTFTDAMLAANPLDPTRRGITFITSIDQASHLYPVAHELEEHAGLFTSLSYVGSWLDIPTDLRVVFGQCHQKNAFYSPKHKAIVFCYELVAAFAEYFRDRQHLAGADLGRAVVGATVFSLLHELGHALSDLYGFPMLGNEEDAADRVAALLLLEEGDVGNRRAYAGAFGMLALDDGTQPAWFDEHSVGPQRYFNVMCLLVGADASHLSLVSDRNFVEHRAPRCAGEFAKARASLDVLLMPYYKKGVDTAKLDLPPGPDDLPPLLVVERPRVTASALAAPGGGWPDVVAWQLAHLDRLLTLLEQSEAKPETAIRDVQVYYLLNRTDLSQLASAAQALAAADAARLRAAYELQRSDLQKRLIALSRRSPALVGDARVARALAPLL